MKKHSLAHATRRASGAVEVSVARVVGSVDTEGVSVSSTADAAPGAAHGVHVTPRTVEISFCHHDENCTRNPV